MKPLKHFMIKPEGEKNHMKLHSKELKKHSGPNGSNTLKNWHQEKLDQYKSRLKRREYMKRVTDI